MKQRNTSPASRLLRLLSGGALALGLTTTGLAQGTTAFTYQGRLNDGTNPATGWYDLKFTLYDAASGGGIVVGTVPAVIPAAGVTNGLFTVSLNFGPTAFTGAARWLDIAVRTNGAGGFLSLNPRQQLTPTPYALYSGNAATLGGQAPGAFAPASGSEAYVAKSGDTMSGSLFLPVNGLTAGGSQLVLKSSAVGIGGDPGDALLDVKGNLRLNDYDLFLRYNNGDRGHGLGWYNTSLKPFGSYTYLDGPVLYACGLGGLGSTCAGQNLSLMWGQGGRVILDPGGVNTGSLLPGLLFGGFGSAEGIASRRTVGGNQFGLDFYTFGSNRLAITQSGKVGIGTTAPLMALDVFDGTGANHTGGNIHVGGFYSNGDAKLIHFGDIQPNGLGYVYLGENGQDDRLEFRAGSFYFNYGAVGVGTTNPASILDVAGTVTALSFSGSGAGLTGISTTGIADNSITAPKLASDANSLSKVTAGNMTSSGTAVSLTVNEYLNDKDLYLRNDAFHGLGWYGAGKLFAGFNVNGPALYGADGGVLGTAGGSPHATLGWSSSAVSVFGSLGVTNSLIADANTLNNGTMTPGLLFGGGSSGEGIASKRTAGGNQFGLDLYTGFLPRLSIDSSGRVGIGTNSPQSAFHVVGPARVTGLLRLGSETNSASGPSYPPGSDGLLIRRIASGSSTSNNIVARTDSCILIRDGTTSGLALIYTASSSSRQNITCMAVDRNGTSVNYKNTMTSGSGARLYVFNDSQRIVHYDISFGNVYNGGHTCHVVLDRYDDGTSSDSYMVGTLTTTYNQ